MQLPLTAIICTLNRDDLLPRAIESLAEQTLCKSQYEILVVDNGSIDKTRSLVEKKQQRIENLKYLLETKRGLSRARNAGAAASRGEIVAYMDDDAFASPTWLENILNIFGTMQPRPGVLCGPVQPIWGGLRPEWLNDHFLSYYSILNHSSEQRLLNESEWIVGANMAIPRDVILECGGFHEQLGRKGKSLLCGEETALTNRVRARGYGILYDPALLVHHYIHPERLSKLWLYRRIFWGGVTYQILQNLGASRDKNGASARSLIYQTLLSQRTAENILITAGQLYGRLIS